ncbi:hypothetical protein HDU82_002338, partial [Entophlyctis luteolus]
MKILNKTSSGAPAEDILRVKLALADVVNRAFEQADDGLLNEVDKAKFVQAIREIDLAVVDIDAIQASDEREWGLYLWIPTVNLISKKENRLPIQVAVKRIREAESLLSPLPPNSKFSFNNLAEVVLANSQSILQLKNVKKELSKIRTWALESVNQSTG